MHHRKCCISSIIIICVIINNVAHCSYSKTAWIIFGRFIPCKWHASHPRVGLVENHSKYIIFHTDNCGVLLFINIYVGLPTVEELSVLFSERQTPHRVPSKLGLGGNDDEVKFLNLICCFREPLNKRDTHSAKTVRIHVYCSVSFSLILFHMAPANNERNPRHSSTYQHWIRTFYMKPSHARSPQGSAVLAQLPESQSCFLERDPVSIGEDTRQSLFTFLRMFAPDTTRCSQSNFYIFVESNQAPQYIHALNFFHRFHPEAVTADRRH